MNRKKNSLKEKFFVTCPETGRIKSIKTKGPWAALLFPVIGLISLVWFLFRVLPKPSRLSYPCVRIAAPVASGFLVYMLGLITSAVAFHKARKSYRNSGYVLAALFLVVALLSSVLISQNPKSPVYATSAVLGDQTPNNPMGAPKGIFPGRVVWAWNPESTNENCTLAHNNDDGWFMPKNNNLPVVEEMLSDVLQSLTGTTSDQAAWEAIFKYYNNNHDKGDVSYQEGEEIFIKINATSSWSGNFNNTDLSKSKNNYYSVAETNPYVVLAVFKHLVNVVGVPQENIYVGDPMKHIYKHIYDLWHAEFPNIHYLDNTKSSLGREKVVKSVDPLVFYADKGSVLKTEGPWYDPSAGESVYNDHFYTVSQNCDYMINIPCLKGHKRAGVTMFAKNHFGTHTRDSAAHLHNGLVNPTEQDPYRQGYGLYRVLVDLMGHKLIGGKDLVYIMDALYAGPESVEPPTKWVSAPFNDDWCSSIFASLDNVAIESVGYDFLKAEYTDAARGDYPQMVGVDDYLHQAADSNNWPEGVIYDPEDDGTPISSLGVHEHWNNAADKQYSRNLGTGEGIELIKIDYTTSVREEKPSGMITDYQLHNNYPNPFNPSTTIRFDVAAPAHVELDVYNSLGQKVTSLVNSDYQAGSFTATWNGAWSNGSPAASGVYIYQISINGDNQNYRQAKQMLLVK